MKKLVILTLAAAVASSCLEAKPKGRAGSEEDREARKEKAREHMLGVLDEGDTDGDGYYSEGELVDIFSTLQSHRQEMREKMRAKAEESGRELPERKSGGKDREPPTPEDIAERILDRLDDDGDSLVSRDQLEQAMNHMAQRGKRGGKEGKGKA